MKQHFKAIGPAGVDLTIIEQDSTDATKGNQRAHLTTSSIPDTQRLPVKNPGKTVTLANAVAITNTAANDYYLSTQGLLTKAEIQSFKQFKISLANSHDQAAAVTLFTKNEAAGAGLSSSGTLYTEATPLAATTGRLILQPKAGGTGVSALIKVVPALEGTHADLTVRVQFAVAPTSGSLTISIECQ